MTDPRGLTANVLDHGFVRLVDYMGGDLSIVRAARVSHNAAWRAGKDKGSDERLLAYLWKHRHTTPFEAVTLTFEVKAPIFVFRQWHRHRTWSFNEVSARYTELPEEFYTPELQQIGEQSAHNKQGRDLRTAGDTYRPEDRRAYGLACSTMSALYRELLNRGWPRELARMCLPVSTYSHMFATVNLLNLFRFLTLRCDEHAQHEIQVYAHAMVELAERVAPLAVQNWEKTDAGT